MTTFNGTSGNESLTGGAGNDTLYGNAGRASGTMDIRRPSLPLSLSSLSATDLVL